jgi:HEAT repeat protein
MAALQGTNSDVRVIAMNGIRTMGVAARPAIPLLIQILATDAPDESTRAAFVLGELKIESDTVVPALIKALFSTNSITVNESGIALANFGALARPAIPVLSDWLGNPDEWRRAIATNALRHIDPLTFTNAQPTNGGNP